MLVRRVVRVAASNARQGLCWYTSMSEPARAARLKVRSVGALRVGFIPLPHRSRVLGLAGWPVHVGQPIEHPLENQRHDCAASHVEVPLAQLQPHPSLGVPSVLLG